MGVMDRAVLLLGFALACSVGACAPPSARPVPVPPGAVIVVPVEEASFDDEGDADSDAPRAKPTAYVKMSEWTPSPAVQELEAKIPPRGAGEPDYVKFPALTLHREIAPTTVTRSRRLRR
jgi:hypothetical protein